MKKIFLFSLIGTLVLALTGCTPTSFTDNSYDEENSVETSGVDNDYNGPIRNLRQRLKNLRPRLRPKKCGEEEMQMAPVEAAPPS